MSYQNHISLIQPRTRTHSSPPHTYTIFIVEDDFFLFLKYSCYVFFFKSLDFALIFVIFVLMVLLFVVVDVPPFPCNYLPPSCSSPVSFAEFVSVHARPIEKQNLYRAIGGVCQNLSLQTKYLLATSGCTSHNAYHSCWAG